MSVSHRFLLTCLVLTGGVVFLARVFGPGDLYDKDQPKTIAASADVALHGNWIWPREMLLEPSTKPPLYNWLDAAVLRFALVWDEWAFKVPSVLAAVLIAILLAKSAQTTGEGLLAAAIWFASGPVMKHMYLSRPDMVLCAFLTGAWCFGNRWDGKYSALGFWLCVTGAALTKGPPALLAVAYVAIAARLLRGRWSESRRILSNWGILVFVGIVGGWAVLAYLQRPDAFFVYFWNEGGTRFTTGGPESIAKPGYLPVLWFANQFKPWSIFAVAGVMLLGWRKVFRHPLAPAVVWVALVLVVFSLIPGKRADYLLPAYPMAALLAANGLLRISQILRVPEVTAALLPLAMAVYLGHFELTRSPEARANNTRSAIEFARQVRAKVSADDTLIVLIKGYHPLLSLLRRHEGNRARAEDLRDGVWVIMPLEGRQPPHATAQLLPNILQTGPRQIVPGAVGLYRIGDENGPTREQLTPILESQYEWNFPPDRLRVTRDVTPR